jgi:hypothetical protein
LYTGQKNESCQINLKDTSFDSVFCANSQSVFSLRLNVLFEFEKRWIPPTMVIVPVKTIFVNIRKKRKRKLIDTYVTGRIMSQMR